MLNMLRFDFYKLTHSKIMRYFWILPVILWFINPVTAYFVHKEQISVMKSLYSYSSPLQIAIWMFVILFVIKDYSSGYMKNIYSNLNTVFYTLSKIFYLLVFSIIFVAGSFFTELIINGIANSSPVIYGGYEIDGFTVGDFFLKQLSLILNSLAIGSIVFFLCSLIKKEYIVLIIVAVYVFLLSIPLYNAINWIIGNGFDIRYYTVFNYIPSTTDITRFIISGIVVPVCYTAVFSFSSWLMLKYKNI